MNLNVHEVVRYGLLLALGVCAYLLVMTWTQDYGGSQVQDEFADPAVTVTNSADASLDALNGGESIPTAETDSSSSDVPDSSLIRTGQGSVATASGGRVTPAADLIRVQTPLQHVWIDPIGGDIQRIDLPQHPVSLDRPDIPLILLRETATRTYIAQSGLVGQDGFDSGGQKPRYQTSRKNYEVDSTPVDVVLTSSRTDDAGGTIKLSKIFTFDPEQYVIQVRHVVENQSSNPWSANLFAQLTHDGKQGDDSSTFFGPRPYLGAALTTTDTRYEKISFEDVEEEQFREEVNGGWMALLQHYFLSAWVPSDEASYLYYGMRDTSGRFRFGFTGPEITVAPGDIHDFGLQFYAGPKVQRALSDLAEHLELTVDYGFLWFLSIPLFYVLEFAHSLVGNWGVAIILLTIVVKLILYPLSAMSYKSMAKMRTVTPQIKRIQERFSGDRQRLSQEMMSLYSKEGVNPLTGCLPMLAQMPVFLALYWVLYESVELRHAPFFLWIHDLSAMDPFFVLPILMGASMFLMQMLNPPMPDPMQQKMMKIMPVLFTVLFVFFPAGLVLYWLMNNVLSYAQQFYVTKRIEAENAKKGTAS